MLTYANFGIINVVAMKFRDETFKVRFVDWQRVPPANPGTNRIFVNIQLPVSLLKFPKNMVTNCSSSMSTFSCRCQANSVFFLRKKASVASIFIPCSGDSCSIAMLPHILMTEDEIVVTVAKSNVKEIFQPANLSNFDILMKTKVICHRLIYQVNIMLLGINLLEVWW